MNDSISLKAAMAVSGAVMVGWLTLHMLGNLTVFAGPELMNGYALKLREAGVLWPVRAVLVAALVVHVGAAIATSLRSRAARTTRYRVALKARASSTASRTMRLTGALLFAYIIYHVAQIYGVGHPGYVPGDVHHNLISVMKLPLHLALYVGGTALICLHLAHGMRSALQSLGVLTGRRERVVQRALYGWAFAVTAGFALTSLGPALGLG